MGMITKQLSENFWRDVAHQMNEAKQDKSVSEVVANIAQKYGLAKQTIYRNANKFGFFSGKKRRSTAKDEEQEYHLLRLFALYHQKREAKTCSTPLEPLKAQYILENPGAKLPSTSRCYQIMRERKISRKDSFLPTKKVQLAAKYPGHVGLYDTSVCRHYIDPKTAKVLPIHPRDDYKNKPGRYLKKLRLKRHIYADHFSNAFYVQYSFTQKAIDYAEFLYDAWAPKGPEFPLQGVPEVFIIDKDAGLHSYPMYQLYAALGIDVPHATPYSPWIRGAVERLHRFWEVHFENFFFFQISGDLEEINRWAFNKSIEIQNRAIHTRHKMTRFDCFHSHAGTIREVPSREDFMRLMHTKEVEKTVRADGYFKHLHKEYKTKVFNTKVDIIIHPLRYKDDNAITYIYPAKSENFNNYPMSQRIIETVTPTETGVGGYRFDAVPIGTYRKEPQSENEKLFNKLKETEVSLHPFDDKGENIVRMPLKTEKILIHNRYNDVGNKTYNDIEAAVAVSVALNRDLTENESKLIDGDSEYTQDDIDRFVELFSSDQRKRA